MTSYRTKEEVEKEFEKVSYDTDDEDFNLRNEPAVAFSDAIEKVNKLRLSDLEAHIEEVEWMKPKGKKLSKEKRDFSYGLDMVLTYLNSLKENKI